MVLIVDDCADICRMLSVYFRSVRIESHAVNGGVAALLWLEVHRPVAVILDVHMPDLNGLDVLDVIRSKHGPDALPVIMHSATADPYLPEAASERGANATVFKATPTCLADLLRLVREFSAGETRGAEGQEAARCA